MPLTAPIALFGLISVALGTAAAVRRSRKLGWMAAGAFLMTVAFVILLTVGTSTM